MYKILYLPKGEFINSVITREEISCVSIEEAKTFLPYVYTYYYEIVEVPDV